MKRSNRLHKLVGITSLLLLAGCGVGPEGELFDEAGLERLSGDPGKADRIPYQLCFDDDENGRALVYHLSRLQEPQPWGVKVSFALDEQNASNVLIEASHSYDVLTSDWEPFMLPMRWMLTPGEQQTAYTWLGYDEQEAAKRQGEPELAFSFGESTGLHQIIDEVKNDEPTCVTVNLEYRYCGPEVVYDPQHIDHAFCYGVARRSKELMTEDYADKLLGL